MNMGMPTGTTAAGSSPTGSAMNNSMGDMGDMMGMGGTCQISVRISLIHLSHNEKSNIN